MAMQPASRPPATAAAASRARSGRRRRAVEMRCRLLGSRGRPGFLGSLSARRRGIQCGCILAVAQNHGDRRVDRHVIGSFRHQNLAERPLVDRLHLHGGFVGLDLGDHVTGLDRVALPLVPLGDVALLHGGRERRHQDLDRHGRITVVGLSGLARDSSLPTSPLPRRSGRRKGRRAPCSTCPPAPSPFLRVAGARMAKRSQPRRGQATRREISAARRKGRATFVRSTTRRRPSSQSHPQARGRR